MIRKTRKRGAATAAAAAKAKDDVLTIPQLKQAFDYIEDFAKSGPTTADFLIEWRRVFHRPISKEHATAYIKFIVGHNKGKSQHGGAPGVFAGQGMLPGAVTDAGLRPYGSFPSYVASGFEVEIPMPAQAQACALGVPGIGPQDGGRRGRRGLKTRRDRGRAVHRGGRIPFSTTPPSFMQNLATTFRGQALPPSSSPIENPYL